MGRTIQFVLALQLVHVCTAGQAIGILFDFGTQPEAAIVDLMESEITDILACKALRAVHEVDEVVDEVQQTFVSPVKILEVQNERRGGSQCSHRVYHFSQHALLGCADRFAVELLLRAARSEN